MVQELFFFAFIFFSVLFPEYILAEQKANRPFFASIEPSVLKEWLTINLYKTKKDGVYKSEIVNPEYFTSPIGRTNPFAEFSAFKSLILDYLKNGDHQEILCKFPARMTLFSKNFEWFSEADRPKCTEYNEQNKPELITSVSLIFVSGYFDNPSSYYGHTLLKFNYGKDILNQTSIDSSINYGATITDSQSSPLYVINGLFGGYIAKYVRNNHFLYTHNYTNNQTRDMWEYKLVLTPQQIKFISEFTWELMNTEFKYYFFNDNCAHRISKILELALGINLSDSHGFWLLPMQVVRSLGRENNRESSNLIEEEKYHPSLKRTFFDGYNLLSKKEKEDLVGFFINSSHQEQIEAVKKLNSTTLLLILDYLDIQVARRTSRNKDEQVMADLQTQRSVILSQLWRYPVETIQKLKGKGHSADSLLSSQPASVIRTGYGIREDSHFAKISYRVANNDFFNIPGPGQEISKFIMGEMETEITDESIRLTQATVIDIVNFNTNPLPIRVTKEFSWGLKVDYSPRSVICSKCSTFGVEAKGGTASRISSRTMLYGLIGGRIHTKLGNDRGIFTTVSEAGVFINVTKKLILGLSANHYYDAVFDNSEYFLKAEAGFNFSRNYDFRARLESDGEDVVSVVSAGYYFD